MEQNLSKSEQERLARLKASRWRKIKSAVIWLAIIAAIAGSAYLVVAYSQKARSQKPGEEIADQGREHIAEGSQHEPYNSNPPTSGPHYAAAANWGVYDNPLPDEQLIHNLEHGGIWISYKPDISPETLAKLKDIADDYTLKVILTPRAENDLPIAVAAWGRLLKLKSADQKQIQDFIKAFINKGPEQVPY